MMEPTTFWTEALLNMSTRIRLRRDTAANWTSFNPTLTTGEMGYETNTGKFKIGDNSTAWTSLAYSITAELSEGNLNDLKDVTITSAANGDFLRWNGTAWINDAVNLATDTVGSFVESLVAGTGITLANNSGEGATPTITVDTSAIQARVANVTDTEIGYLDGVTSAIQTQIDLKAALASPTFTGTPLSTTASAGTNTTQVATTAFVRAEVAALVNSAGATLDTLGEIATALGNDASLSTTLTNSIALKAPLASPTFTGTVTIPSGASISGFAPLASPTFTGTPTLPTGTIATTQTAANNTTAVATTAYVDTADALKANLASPTFTGTPTLPTGTIATTQTAADSSTKVATTAFVTTAVSSATIDSLDAIADVTITSAVSGDLLKWNGTAWVNIAATFIDSITKLDGGNAFTIQYNSLGPVINAGSI